MRSGDNALFGRALECSLIDAMIGGLRSGQGGSLIFTGNPGIGKTGLLRYAAAHATGVRVLAASGVPAEAVLAFAGLHELLKPVLDLLGRLPPRQAAALSAGLALSPAATVDPLALAAGTLSLLVAAGRDTPLLVLVDDVDLLDAQSRDAVLFAARRAGPEGIGMLLSTSAGADATGLPSRRISPLDPDAGLELLRASNPGPVAPAVAEDLVRETAGTPLALVEASAVLTPEQLAGAVPLPQPVPVGPAVLRAFTPLLGGLAPEKRAALLVAAAAGDAGLAEILDALALLDLPADALSAADVQDLVAVVGDRLEFRHPLVRAVAYHDAGAAQRRAAHQVLATVAPPARRAWHLGVAALAPDELAGDELEQIVCGPEPLPLGAAARLMERAAELTTIGGVQARRCVAAAELWQLAGAPGRTRRLLDRAGRLTRDLRVRAQAQAVLGQAESRCGRPVQACRLLAREAIRVRGTDPTTAAVMLLDAADAGSLAGECRSALVAVHQARLLAGRIPAPLPAVLAGQHAAVLARCGRLAEARALLAGCRAELDQVVLQGDLPTGWRRTVRVGYPALLARLGELDAAWRILDEVIAQSRVREAAGLLPALLVERAEVAVRAGDWACAHATAEEAATLAEPAGQTPDLVAALVCLARLAATRGRAAECAAHLERARAIAGSGQLAGLAVPMGAVEGLLALGAGDYGAAYARLERVASMVEAGGPADHGRVSWAADLVEAAVHVGHVDRARRVLTEASRHASGSLMLPVVLARCAALLAGNQAEPLFTDAVREEPSGVEPFERARAQLCFGEWLRDHGRAAEAGRRLDAARAVFEELGARPWAERARCNTDPAPIRPGGSLDPATGAAPVPGPPAPPPAPPTVPAPADPPVCPKPEAAGRAEAIGLGAKRARINGAATDALTEQERRVSMLVGQGATNREAARALYLSPKTIEFHLRSVYRKLGVRSRAELAHLIGRTDPGVPQT